MSAPYMYDPLTKEQEDVVLTETNYTRAQLDADVKYIREWMSKQHHLPPSALKEKDSFLAYFLTGCKGSLETTKRKLDGYYTIRGHSELFENRDPLDRDYAVHQKVPNFGSYTNVPENKTVRVLFAKLGDPDPDKFDFLILGKKLMNLDDMYLRSESIAMRMLVVFDFEGCSLTHAFKLKPFLLRDMLRLAQDVLPFRFDQVYMINAPPFIHKAYKTLVNPYLSKKLKDRVHLLCNSQDLHEYLDKRYLPRDYGGDLPLLEEMNSAWIKREESLRDWFINELSEKCDESKRSAHGDTVQNPYFGVEGSLKKLVID